MFLAELEVVLGSMVAPAEVLVLFGEGCDFLPALCHLLNSHSQGVLGLGEQFCGIVVFHYLCLGGLLAVHRLALVFVCQRISLRDIRLQVLDVALGVQDPVVEHGQIVDSGVNVLIEPVVFVLVADDLLLQDLFLRHQLIQVFLSVSNLPPHILLLQAQLVNLVREGGIGKASLV